MIHKKLVFPFFFAVFLVSCNTKKLEIENPDLNDKVKACGGGIGLSESLNAHIMNLHRDLSPDAKPGVGFQEQIKPLLFSELSELPAQDRLKAIEDYQQCIQKLHVDTKRHRSNPIKVR